MATTTTTTSGTQPLQLDRLQIPGFAPNVPGYDGGVNAMLLASGLTVMVNKNWLTTPGDVITVVHMPELVQLATYRLKPGDEEAASYFLNIEHKDLPDGAARLGYVVNYKNGGEDTSYTLSVLVKTDLPGGKNNNPPLPGVGHSELKFSLSTTTVYPPDAIRGVTVTVQPYPNMHANDILYFNWGSVLITHQVAGVGLTTVFTITHAQLIEGGDGIGLLAGFYVVDVVANPSSARSTDTKVLVELDSSKLDAPAIKPANHDNTDPPGQIDLEKQDGEDLTIEMYTREHIGKPGDTYDLDFRAYPPLGDVIVHRGLDPVVTEGWPVYHKVPYDIVRAAAGGRVEAKFVLRKLNPPSDLYSNVASALVVGSFVRLQAPYFPNYPDHIVNPIPNSAVVEIPYYQGRKPDDELTVIMRHVRGMNDVVVYSKTFPVGTSWPDGAPVKHLIYRQDLERFNTYTPDLYYVIGSATARARSTDLNESLRQRVQIGVPG